ncbi:hypothetical protein TPENAI_40047 [Tenacibaculum litopenaei]|uniref:hypothetical protein n=1 Tax=Tenacibaculum litopenaei TaxID=396016 RepID=UPI003895FB5D
MKEYIEKFMNNIDLEKLQYKSLGLYEELLSNEETIVDLEEDLPEGVKMNDIKIEYEDLIIHFKDGEISRVFLNYKLNLKEEQIGYYKTEYSIFEDLFIDDYLVFY